MDSVQHSDRPSGCGGYNAVVVISKLSESMNIDNESKTQKRINDEARVFGYAINPKLWKSFTPLNRIEGYKSGATRELKRTLVIIDSMLNESDSQELKTLRHKILEL